MKSERTLLELYQMLFWYYSFNHTFENYGLKRTVNDMHNSGIINRKEWMILTGTVSYYIYKHPFVTVNYEKKIIFLQTRIEELK